MIQKRLNALNFCPDWMISVIGYVLRRWTALVYGCYQHPDLHINQISMPESIDNSFDEVNHYVSSSASPERFFKKVG
jgi:hypothetical protein